MPCPIAEALCSIQQPSLLLGDPCMAYRLRLALLFSLPSGAALPKWMHAFAQRLVVAVNNK